MSKQFNPKAPHSTVSGDSPAAYYQNGQYFTAQGKPISHAEAASPSVGGSFSNAVDAEVRRRTEPSEDALNQSVRVEDPGNPNGQRPITPPPGQPAPAPETPQPNNDERRAQLEALKTRDLNNAVAELGHAKFTGGTARKKAIEFLLANTD